MELSLMVFELCFLYQILPRTCSSSSEQDFNERNGSSDAEPIKDDSDEGTRIPNASSDEDTNRIPNVSSDEDTNTIPERTSDPEYEAEKKAGDTADLFTTNQHHSYPTEFNDFGRRFVPVYPYTEVTKEKNENDELVPIKTAPEKVLAVALKSALARGSIPVNNSEQYKKEKEILRTGDYWNALWVEDVDPKTVLRSYTNNKLKLDKQKQFTSSASKLRSVRTKIMPGSKLYQLVSVLQQFSPRLLYVINK